MSGLKLTREGAELDYLPIDVQFRCPECQAVNTFEEADPGIMASGSEDCTGCGAALLVRAFVTIYVDAEPTA